MAYNLNSWCVYSVGPTVQFRLYFMSSLRLGLRYCGCHGERIRLPVDRCILFLRSNPDPEAGQFRLIIAANRDEYFKRPAKRAHFWEEQPDILGGRDMEPGREGGSWFAVSKKGRISALLSVMGGTFADMKTRGSIVPDYLTAGSSAEEHLSSLKERAHEYSLFNLLAVDVRRDGVDVHQMSNVGNTRQTVMSGRGYLGIGNHLLGHPTLKVTAGLSRFAAVVEKLGSVQEKHELTGQLLDLLKWDKKHYPDPVLDSLTPNAIPEIRQALSSVFISDVGTGYGTRAHTIVLVDNEDRVDFFEWAMEEPIQPQNPQWKTQHFTFQMDYGK